MKLTTTKTVETKTIIEVKDGLFYFNSESDNNPLTYHRIEIKSREKSDIVDYKNLSVSLDERVMISNKEDWDHPDSLPYFMHSYFVDNTNSYTFLDITEEEFLEVLQAAKDKIKDL